MNKVLTYFVLLIGYLVLNKAVSPENSGIKYIKSQRGLKKLIKSVPAEAVLMKTMVKGYVIKTYYQKYRIIYGFSDVEEIVVKTKRSFAEKSKKYTGMSLFRSNLSKNSIIPMPPGTLFIGNSQFGRWLFENGIFYWKFYRAYSHFPHLLGWGNFKPSKDFHSKIQTHLKESRPFFGFNAEFGENGFITAKFIPLVNRQRNPVFNKLKYLINDYKKNNFQY